MAEKQLLGSILRETSMVWTRAPDEWFDFEVTPFIGRMGSFAEGVALEEYLKHVRRSRVYPWNSKDFSDFTFGFANTTIYTAFLKDHNPHLSIGELLVMRGYGLRKIPDICTHDDPRRLEYYECKPSSASGRADGLRKMAEIDGFNDNFNLPYKPGKIWKPDFIKIIVEDEICGTPLKTGIHIKKESDGLILWTFMYWHPPLVIVDAEQLPEWYSKLIKLSIKVMKDHLGRLMGKVTQDAAPVAIGAEFSIRGSVGKGGVNSRQDVKFVQFLLNAALEKHGARPLKIDGTVGPLTVGAAERFQKGFLPRPDGLISPTGPSIRRLVDHWQDRIAQRLQHSDLLPRLT